MKSKEQILNDNAYWSRELLGYHEEEDVKRAMDEYAQQLAIAFGEWIRENRWVPQEHLSEPDCWRFFNHTTGEEIEKSTEQLHAQFIESQNKTND